MPIDCVMIFHVGGFFHTVAGENEPFVAEITEILSVGGRLVKARLFGSSQFFSDLSICFCIYIPKLRLSLVVISFDITTFPSVVLSFANVFASSCHI